MLFVTLFFIAFPLIMISVYFERAIVNRSLRKAGLGGKLAYTSRKRLENLQAFKQLRQSNNESVFVYYWLMGLYRYGNWFIFIMLILMLATYFF